MKAVSALGVCAKSHSSHSAPLELFRWHCIESVLVTVVSAVEACAKSHSSHSAHLELLRLHRIEAVVDSSFCCRSMCQIPLVSLGSLGTVQVALYSGGGRDWRLSCSSHSAHMAHSTLQ